MATKTFCDLCGTLIGVAPVATVNVDGVECELTLSNKGQTAELCKECLLKTIQESLQISEFKDPEEE